MKAKILRPMYWAGKNVEPGDVVEMTPAEFAWQKQRGAAEMAPEPKPEPKPAPKKKAGRPKKKAE